MLMFHAIISALFLSTALSTMVANALPIGSIVNPTEVDSTIEPELPIIQIGNTNAKRFRFGGFQNGAGGSFATHFGDFQFGTAGTNVW
ncbi:hypothetical protein K474DRAFT_1709234 [Panus rudis PR-1116 ss-1]|nr:hypothetical protein K474DRAFT_1709234 [Panus rudis PR-1116 ss-1]